MEISGFFCHSDFTCNQVWSFWSPKNYHFTHLRSSEFQIFGNFWHFQVWNYYINQNSMPPKLLKQQFLTFWNEQKLISRKIRTAAQLLNFQVCRVLWMKMQIKLATLTSFRRAKQTMFEIVTHEFLLHCISKCNIAAQHDAISLTSSLLAYWAEKRGNLSRNITTF